MHSDKATGLRVIRARSVLRPVIRAVLAAPLLLPLACSGSLYKVKPASELVRLPDSAATANLGSVSFRAALLLTDEESQELFESNFLLAGLLPVLMQFVHNRAASFELKIIIYLYNN